MSRNRQPPLNKSNKSKRGRKPHRLITQIEQLYKVINKVQTDKEMAYIYFKDDSLIQTALNVIKDTGIEVEEAKAVKKILYRLKPDMTESAMEDIDVDMFDDEMLEEGFLF